MLPNLARPDSAAQRDRRRHSAVPRRTTPSDSSVHRWAASQRDREFAAHRALELADLVSKSRIPEEARKRLELLAGGALLLTTRERETPHPINATQRSRRATIYNEDGPPAKGADEPRGDMWNVTVVWAGQGLTVSTWNSMRWTVKAIGTNETETGAGHRIGRPGWPPCTLCAVMVQLP